MFIVYIQTQYIIYCMWLDYKNVINFILSSGNTNSDDHNTIESDTELEKAECSKPSMCKPLVIFNSKVFHNV